MKKITITLFALLSVITSFTISAQAPSIQWAKGINGTSSRVMSVGADASGNTFIAGYWSSSVDFDPSATTLTYNSTGLDDMFIEKLDVNGNLVWVKTIGGTGEDYCYRIKVDAAGDVYACGSYTGTVDFDPGPAISNLTNSGGLDAFIAKFSPAGNLIWAKKTASTAGDDYGYGICYNSTNVFTTGNTGTLFFIGKYDASGIMTWQYTLGGNGSSDNQSRDIEVDGSGNTYITGGVTGQNINFDPLGSYVVAGNSSNYQNIFFAKYTPTGSCAFAYELLGTGFLNKFGVGIDLDATGNIVISGDFGGTVDFDPSGSTANKTTTGTDTFIAKFDNTAGFIFVDDIGGTDGHTTRTGDMDVDDVTGNIYITGNYGSDPVDLDPGPATFYVYRNSTLYYRYEIYCAGYDQYGNFLFGAGWGDASDDYGLAVYSDATGFYTSGDMSSSSINFDFNGGGGTINNWGGYVCKYSSCTVAPVQPSAISGNTTVCANGAYNFSITPVAGATSYLWSVPSGWTGSSTTSSISGTAGSTGGNISVYAVNDCGTSTASTVSATVSTVTVALTAQYLNTCSNWTNDILTGTPSGGIFSGLGVSGSNFDPSFPGLGVYNVYYNYTNGFGCTGLDTIQIAVNSCTGINQLTSGNEELLISPNPSSGVFTLTTENKIQSIKVVNVLGEVINEQSTANNGQLIIDLSKEAKGIYFVQGIDENKNSFNKKVIIK